MMLDEAAEGVVGYALRRGFEAKKFSVATFTPHDLRRTALKRWEAELLLILTGLKSRWIKIV